MKTILLTIFTIIALTAIIYSGLYWMRQHQVKAEHEIVELRELADSLIYLQSQMDSMILVKEEIIAAQDLVIQSRELEIINSREASNKIRKQYENIVFKSYANDSLRLRELSRHFPSLSNR